MRKNNLTFSIQLAVKVFSMIILAALIFSDLSLFGASVARAEEETVKRLSNASVPSRQAGYAGAVVSLSTDRESFGVAEDVVLDVTISNPNAYPIRILKWFTPADGLQEPLFSVSLDGIAAPYIGPIHKRTPPTDRHYITLEPDEELNYEVNLATYYNLSNSGNYVITYDVNSPDLYWDSENEKTRIFA